MIPLAAYVDRMSVAPGETVRVHGRGPEGAVLNARIVRVISADPNPELGGVRTEPVASEVALKAPLSERDVPLGSYGEVDLKGRLATLGSFSFTIRSR